MKKIFFIIIVFLSSHHLIAQWHTANSNTSAHLNHIFFINDSMGFCSGGGNMWGDPDGKGIILQSTDGGENWFSIFEQDSLVIQSVFVLEKEDANMLYAFALKNRAYYLIHSPLELPLAWEISPITYKPLSPTLQNNSIYFIDGTDYHLKRMDNSNTISTIAEQIALFGVNQNELSYINGAVNTVYTSHNYGNTWVKSINFPSYFTGDRLTHAAIKSFGDTIIIRGTYPGMTLSSLDNGTTWENKLHAPDFVSFILDTKTIYSVDNQNNIKATTNTGDTWEIQINAEERIRDIYFFNHNLGFAVGEYGTIYKYIKEEVLTSEQVNAKKNSIFTQILQKITYIFH